MTRADTCLFEHVLTRAIVDVSFLCLCPVLTESSCAHLRMAQVNKRLEICLDVSCKSALVVLSLHSYTVLACCSHLPDWSILLQHHNPERVLKYTIHNPDEC